MKCLLYIVVATLPDQATAQEYLAWLESGHVDKVVAGGAQSGKVVRLEPATGQPPGQVQVMTLYVFASQELFDRYERDFAPALREEGKSLFLNRGVSFTRSLIDVPDGATDQHG